MTNGLTRSANFLLLASLLVGCGNTSSAPLVSALGDSPAVESAKTESVKTEPQATESPAVKVAQLADQKADKKTDSEKPRYTVHKRAVPTPQPMIPQVLLSGAHKKLCKVNVGDMLPNVSLPSLNGTATDLNSLLGKQATVVLFWHPDRWMARTALVDMQRDIAAQLHPQQVSVVGIAVQQARGNVQASLNEAQASFPQLLDTDGNAFAAVGTAALPRIYVLDPTGKIVWFDIEYSEATRRELWQTLRVLTAK